MDPYARCKARFVGVLNIQDDYSGVAFGSCSPEDPVLSAAQPKSKFMTISGVQPRGESEAMEIFDALASDAATPMTADRVLSAGADADGKNYTISLALENGRQISLRIPPPEAIEIVDGLSKTATSAAQKQQTVAIVQTINLKADTGGRAIILTPHVRTGPLDTFAVPIGLADQFIGEDPIMQQAAGVIYCQSRSLGRIFECLAVRNHSASGVENKFLLK